MCDLEVKCRKILLRYIYNLIYDMQHTSYPNIRKNFSFFFFTFFFPPSNKSHRIWWKFHPSRAYRSLSFRLHLNVEFVTDRIWVNHDVNRGLPTDVTINAHDFVQIRKHYAPSVYLKMLLTFRVRVWRYSRTK